MHNGSLCCFQTNEAAVTPTAQAKSRRAWWSQLAVAKTEFVSANEGFDDINNADSEEARKIKDLCVCVWCAHAGTGGKRANKINAI